MASINENVRIIRENIDEMKRKLSLPATATLAEVTAKAGDIDPVLQNKTVSPNDESAVVVTADDNYDGLGTVTVSKIAPYMISDLDARKIKKDEIILGVVGTYGPTSQVKNITPSLNEQTIRPDSGFEYLSAVTVDRVTASIDGDIAPENIRNGINILGVTGTFEGDFKFQEKTGHISAEDEIIITPDNGYDALTKVVIPRVTSRVDSDITPGNIRQGVNILGVTGTYAPAPSMVDKTIYPSTSRQTIYPDSGYGTFDKVTVEAVGASIDSSIKSSNIREGIEILGVIGGLEPVKGEDIVVLPQITNQTVVPTEGKNAITSVTVPAVTHTIDDKIIAENIKQGISILGVEGTFNGELNNLQTKTITPSDAEQIITADTGYDALATVTVEPTPVEDITIEPSVENRVISRTPGKFINTITLPKVTADIDVNIRPENIKENMSILGVIGTYAGEEQTYFGAIPAGSTSQPGIGKAIINVPENLRFSSTDGSYAFYNTLITKVPNIDYSGLTNVSYMFGGCTKINDWTYLHLPTSVQKANGTLSSITLPSQDLVFNLPNATELNYFLSGTTQNGGSVTINIGSKCTGCNSLLQKFKGKKVVLDTIDGAIAKPTFQYMFQGCTVDEVIISDNIRPTSLAYAFYTSSNEQISHVKHVTLNISECTTMAYMFDCGDRDNYTESLTFNGTSSKLTNMERAFYFNQYYQDICLHTVTGAIYAGKVNNVRYCFSRANKLVNFDGLIDLGKGYTQKSANYNYYTLDLTNATSLSAESLRKIINGLYDLNLTYNVAGGGTLYRQKIQLGTHNNNKITDADRAIATNKGWTVE